MPSRLRIFRKELISWTVPLRNVTNINNILTLKTQKFFCNYFVTNLIEIKLITSKKSIYLFHVN